MRFFEAQKPLYLLAIVSFAGFATAAYTAVEDYTPGDYSSFFSKFTFYDGNDPTHGSVDYVDEATAQAKNLVEIVDGKAFVRVSSEPLGDGERQSVRLETKARFTTGLFIADIEHMPSGVCGVWPAMWTFGDPWPDMGEIDFIENVHDDTNNNFVLHTTAGCQNTMGPESFTGTVKKNDCFIANDNIGCGIKATGENTSGKPFNDNQGGVYAMEWTTQQIRVWIFPRASVPIGIFETPDPSAWDTPAASFGGGCDIPTYFKSHKLIINTTLCGDWAGNVWNLPEYQKCSALAPTCEEFVRGNPEAFQEAYWTFNRIKVFQNCEGLSPEQCNYTAG